jgi:hypothetical protein
VVADAGPGDVTLAARLGVLDDGRLTTVVAFTVHDSVISRIDLIRAPHKLPALPHN